MPEKEDRWLFYLIYFLIGTLIAGSVLMVYLGESRKSQSLIALEEQMDLETQEKLVNLRFDSIISDTLFLTSLDDLKVALHSTDYSAVGRDFLSFITAKKSYDQIRFIDSTGMEIVRVNSRDGMIQSIAAENLQNKSGRYYVKDALSLPEGAVYVSPLDLNVEKGEIENPRVPMIRFVSPVYADGEMKGLIVINYRAALMLEELETFGARNKGDFYLLNPDGYYLASPDDDREWGFMYPDGGENRYSLEDTVHWEQISRNDAFQYESSSSIISSRIIRPLDGLNVTADDYHWIALSVVQEDQISENVHSLLLRLFLLGAFLFLLSAIPAWSISQIVIRLRRIRRELYKSANFDELTALPNRHMFNDRLEQAFIQARRYKQKGALLFIDLDRFKAVNDSYGHEIGDELLQKVGERLDACIRESDTAARFGGDEFVVLIPVEQDSGGAEILAGKLIEIISQPYRLTGVEVSVGASIGIRIFPEKTDNNEESVETILKDADTAMYKAKTGGKGRFAVWKSEK